MLLVQGVLCDRPGCGDVLLPSVLHGQRADDGLTREQRAEAVQGEWSCCSCTK
jgi:hypothetical protein